MKFKYQVVRVADNSAVLEGKNELDTHEDAQIAGETRRRESNLSAANHRINVVPIPETPDEKAILEQYGVDKW